MRRTTSYVSQLKVRKTEQKLRAATVVDLVARNGEDWELVWIVSSD
jgi:hypothetical protein